MTQVEVASCSTRGVRRLWHQRRPRHRCAAAVAADPWRAMRPSMCLKTCKCIASNLHKVHMDWALCMQMLCLPLWVSVGRALHPPVVPNKTTATSCEEWFSSCSHVSDVSQSAIEGPSRILLQSMWCCGSNTVACLQPHCLCDCAPLTLPRETQTSVALADGWSFAGQHLAQ